MARREIELFTGISENGILMGRGTDGPDFSVPRATAPRPVPEDVSVDDPKLFFNRELSWLDFNWRVLYQATDDRNPLLERVRFLAIAASNLDEFFRKRVGGLKRQLGAGVQQLSTDGRSPRQQLELISEAATVMYRKMIDTWEEMLRPALAEQAGINILTYGDLSSEDREKVYRHFRDKIYPILTPLAVDPGHPFPFISNLSLSLAVTMDHRTRGTKHIARLKVPISRGRWLELSRPMHFVPVEQVIAHHIGELFPGMEVTGVSAFRITRNADISRSEEEAEDLLAMISDEVRERRFAPVVRLEIDQETLPAVRRLLVTELNLEGADVFESHGLLELSDCAHLAALDLPEFRYPVWDPIVPTRLMHEGESGTSFSIFDEIRKSDLLIHHPFESFASSVQRFIEEAAVDPAVVAIKQTLYRTSDDSPGVAALTRAAENGKQVAVLIEVKARFDEENNMEWGQKLEKAGVHVTYGLVGLKTHCKVTLVLREEEEGIRAYCHIGTGNYHPETARQYTDVGVFTCSPEIGYDVINLFHYLTGYAPEQKYGKLLVAPRDMRPAFSHLIRRETELHKKYGNGRIIAKMNALDDDRVISQLYAASRAGVSIDLIVRGRCRLRPGLPGYSENIRVISIVGRFLEHSRIFYFHHNGEHLTFIGSADWQRRNLDDRVEVVAPVEDEVLKYNLIRTLYMALEDNRLAWDLDPDGHYVIRVPGEDEAERAYHDLLMHRARLHSPEADLPWDIAPHERRPGK